MRSKSTRVVVCVAIMVFLGGLLALVTVPGDAQTDCPCLWSFFNNSLHFTGNGMRYWYEEPNGFMSVTNIPYDNLNCKECHVKSCDKCHAIQNGSKMEFSKKKSKDMGTCMKCHSREKMTFKFCKAAGRLDVHIAAGMVCADCHYQADIHGDGRRKISMRHPYPKGVIASCKGCHVDQKVESPEFDPDIPSLKVHGDKLDCSACHVSFSMACYNCHFDRAMKEGKKGNFIPMNKWLLLINYQGKVTSGSVMSLVYKSKKFIAYSPYFTHCVSPKGRQCGDCHQNKAVQVMLKGQKVPVVSFRNGKVVPWQGVVPVVPDKLQWVFLRRVGKDKWEPIKDSGKAKVQFAAYGKPLTEEQFKKLAKKVKAPETKK